MKFDFLVVVYSILYFDVYCDSKVVSWEFVQLLYFNLVMICNILLVLYKYGYLMGMVGKNGGY